MKKILAIAIVLALVGAMGCCTSPDNTNKNFGNCVAKVFKPVKGILCPPNETQVDQAAAAAKFLGSMLGKDWSSQVDLARQTFLNVAERICVGLDQLQDAVATFDSAAMVVRTANEQKAEKYGLFKDYVGLQVPDISALRQVVK